MATVGRTHPEVGGGQGIMSCVTAKNNFAAMPPPHTTGALATFAILGLLTFPLAILAILAVADRVRGRLVNGVTLIRGRPGEGGRSGVRSPSRSRT
jgi:hypothetical protein